MSMLTKLLGVAAVPAGTLERHELTVPRAMRVAWIADAYNT
jgi:hypothetical protein